MNLRLLEKRTGSCGITVSRDLSSWRPSRETSCPSTVTDPPLGSIIRKRARARLDLPAPVRPHTPIFSPGLMSAVMLTSTGARPGR